MRPPSAPPTEQPARSRYAAWPTYAALVTVAAAMAAGLAGMVSSTVTLTAVGLVTVSALLALLATLRVAALAREASAAATRLRSTREQLDAVERARRELSRELTHLDSHDPLTGLGNRRALLERMDAVLAQGRRAAVLLCDVEDFKGINDELGHSAGDRLLETLASRLRAFAAPDDLLARSGADELALLFVGGAARSAVEVADQVLEELRRPIVLQGHTVAVDVAVGVVVAVRGDDARALLTKADLALSDARGRRGGVVAYDPARHRNPLDRRALRQQVAGALAGGELEIHYQPLLTAASHRLVGFESLVRWRHPARGLLGPAEFLEAAGEEGLLGAIDLAVLRGALGQLAAWRARHPAAEGLAVTANLSAANLQEPGLADSLAAVLRVHDIAADHLVVELTERALAGLSDTARKELAALRDLGVQIALDDFGAGQSTLLRLVELPINILKISPALVGGVTEDSELIEFVTRLARQRHLVTVAVGVEHHAQATTLADLGCDLLQGRLLGPPAPAGELDGLIARGGLASAGEASAVG